MWLRPPNVAPSDVLFDVVLNWFEELKLKVPTGTK
jgi:hypothetical protein